MQPNNGAPVPLSSGPGAFLFSGPQRPGSGPLATSTICEARCTHCHKILREYPARWGKAIIRALTGREEWTQGECLRCRCGQWLELLYPVLR